ncbi:MAG: hypothetical protein ACI9WU_000190 [Myxococcota bacterium]|jgi:hypothetical protein
MGLFDFLNSDAKEARAVGRWQKRLMNKYMQTAERKRAIEALTQIGTEEAIVALLGRYKYRTEATIVDEDEKQEVFEAVVALGENAIPALNTYIANETAIYFPCKALRRVVGDEVAAATILQSLSAVPDSFGANADRRQQLVDNLRDFSDNPVVYQTLLGLMEDEDEEIVIRAIDGLSARSGDRAVVEAIVPRILQEETSHRVRTLVMELMIEKGWNVKRYKKALTGIIPAHYFIDDTGVVQRR